MTTKVMECDLVVLGAGGSGLVAAVKAFDLTGKKVIILEKSKKPGGCTYFASGMGEAGPVRDSKMQKDGGYEVSEDQDISGQWFDWLVSKGGSESYFSIVSHEQTQNVMGFHYPNGLMGGGGIAYPDRTQKYKNLPDHSIGPGRLGSWVVDKLEECCKKQGIQLLTETRAREFITDGKGKVTAVLADTGDGQLLVDFKACIIAAGGYGRNKELLRKYYPEQFKSGKIHSLCPPAMTGDCILAAEEIGAYIDPTIRSLSFPGGFFADGLGRHPWSPSLQTITGNGKAVIINLDGKRWKNEAGMGGDISEQRDGVACAVVDSDIVDEAASQPSGMGAQDYSKTLKDDLEYEAAMDDAGASGNHTKKADSLVELALKMKIDPRAFVDTMERYNKFCETGKDLDFGKPARSLQAIKKPPFYAVFGNRWSQSTKGRNGIAVNSKFQALDTKGEVIPGLYAVGDGCTIFGGLVLNSPNMGFASLSAEATAARSSLSQDLAKAFSDAPAASQGGMPGGAGGQGMGGRGAGGPGEGGAGGDGGRGAGGPGEGGAGGEGGRGAGGPGEGGAGGEGGMQMMMGGAPGGNILEGEGAACGGLGPAFLSGYTAGTYAALYLKDL